MFHRLLTLIKNLTRWDTWYDSKIPLFFVCMYYAALSRPFDELLLLIDIANLVFILCLYACFGHVVNSFSDRFIDAAAGKPNEFSKISNRFGQIWVGIFVAGSVFFTVFIYHQRPSVVFLLFLTYALAAFYSIPPVRFKERGVLGLIAPAIAQRTLPVLIIFEALMYWDMVALLICILSTVIGLRSIIVHQIKDVDADLRASVKTMATTKGTDYLRNLLMHIIFPLELIFFIVSISVMSINFKLIGIIGVVYMFWLAAQVLALKIIERESFSLEPYIVSSSIFSDFYNLYWPLSLSLLLALDNEKLWVVFLFTILWVLSKLVTEIKYIIHIVNSVRAEII